MNQANIQVGPASQVLLQSSTLRAKSRRVFDAHMFVILGLVVLTAWAIFAVAYAGWEYYLTPLALRPKHLLHESLKPSGLIGQGLGMVAGLFCMLTLLYPLRKRLRILEKISTPRVWFHFHIYFGIAGPLLATLHTTLKFGGLASISYWSMMLVMASGFIGRFIFAQLPRNQRGLVLSIKEIDEEIRKIQASLEAAGIGYNGMNVDLAIEMKKQTGWLSLFHSWSLRRRHLRLWSHLLQEHGFSDDSTRRILKMLSRKFFLEGSAATLDLTTRAFSHWHTLHLPFTYLTFITLVIHVGLAILFGYTWIF